MTLKVTHWLVPLLVLAGFAIGLGTWVAENERSAEPEQNLARGASVPDDRPAATRVRPLPQPAPVSPSTPTPTSSVDVGTSTAASTPSNGMQRSPRASQAAAESTTPRPQANEHKRAVSDDAPVIGPPFPVSPSVEASCKRLSTPASDFCEGAHRLLDKMSRERRDPAWASEMEQKLRDHIATSEPGKFTIRALECRSSVCILEVESILGPYTGGFRSGSPLYKQLDWDLPARGYETNVDSARVTVTLMPYTRQ